MAVYSDEKEADVVLLAVYITVMVIALIVIMVCCKVLCSGAKKEENLVGHTALIDVDSNTPQEKPAVPLNVTEDASMHSMPDKTDY